MVQLMDFHLDKLLNLPDVTVQTCLHQEDHVRLKLRFLSEGSECPHCPQPSERLHQNRPVLIRDLPICGQPVQLEVPRRQFYCCTCQRYFTESLSFVDWERRYTQRDENSVYERVQASSVEPVKPEERLS